MNTLESRCNFYGLSKVYLERVTPSLFFDACSLVAAKIDSRIIIFLP